MSLVNIYLNVGNSYNRSVVYSVKLFVLNKHLRSGGVAYLDCCRELFSRVRVKGTL